MTRCVAADTLGDPAATEAAAAAATAAAADAIAASEEPRGEVTVCVPRIRLRVQGGQSQESRTVDDPGVRNLAIETLRRLAAEGLRGPANVQVIRAPDPVLVEVNPRLGSATVLSNHATRGALLDHVLAGALGLEPDGGPAAYEEGLTMTRFVGEVFHRNGTGVTRQPS